jgi:pyocin large subunit-like protein
MPESETGLYEWTSESNFVEHYEDHAFNEYGQMSEAEYASASESFVETAASNPSIRFFVDRTGSITLYNEATNEFAVVNAQGNIVTYYQPGPGLYYYESQLMTAQAMGNVTVYGGP